MCTLEGQTLKFPVIETLKNEKEKIILSYKEEINSTENEIEIENIVSLAFSKYTKAIENFYKQIDKQLDTLKYMEKENILGIGNLHLLDVTIYLKHIREEEKKKYEKAKEIVTFVIVEETYEVKISLAKKFEIVLNNK